ncbi:MAG: hypothetical protein K2X90_01215 [Candidatus Babeliaceae bacterium]|nr:hypothetical protein [Candidatus Babeliaceae bacterium]
MEQILKLVMLLLVSVSTLYAAAPQALTGKKQQKALAMYTVPSTYGEPDNIY